jgi:stage II sporulation SpoE-like protein
MSTGASRSPARARPTRRLAAALVLACCALSLAIVPDATARRDRTRQSTTEPATAQGSETTAASTAPVAEAEQGAEASEEAASTPASASKSGPARKRAREHRKERESTRSHEGGKRSKKPAQPPTETGSAPGTPTVVAAAPEAAQPTASAASASLTAPTPVPAAAAPKVAVDGRPIHAARRSSRTRRHAERRLVDPAGAAPAGAVAVARVSAAPPPAPRSQLARAGTHGSSKASRRSPLVTTITRIVDVVPAAVGVLIACLLALALALAVRSRLAALRARRLERQRGELLEDVGLLQAALLPVTPARLGPVGTSTAYQPAAGPGAGGDFYDVFALEDGQLAVIVGDVSGHGRQALPHTALVRFTLRAYLEAGLSPRDAVQTAGAVLERQLGGVFATVIAATYQPRERVLVYASAGHPPPVVLGAAAQAKALAPVTACASPPIGVGMRTGTRQTVVSIPGRSQICFYTDGVTEARVAGELFGTSRLVDTLVELGPRASAAAVLARVSERADARPDDMAACLLGVEGDDAAPAVLVEELELDREEAVSDRTARFLLACGVERGELADVVHAACVAAGRAGTVVLELHLGEGPPRLTLRRDHLSYLHARRADVGAAL